MTTAVRAAVGHPDRCEKADLNAPCHCECAGTRHGVVAIRAFQRQYNPHRTPEQQLRRDSERVGREFAQNYDPVRRPAEAEPERAPEPEPDAALAREERRRQFDQRAATARTGNTARVAAPSSNIDPDRPPPLSDRQVDALDSYVGSHYGAINSHLRGTTDNIGVPVNETRVRAWVQEIDSVMDRSRLSDDVAVWRGLGDAGLLFGDRIDGDLSGMEWREDAYVSTSTDRQVSTDFATGDANGVDSPNPVLMRVVVPSGVGAAEMSDESYESELMLQRGLSMRVVTDHGVSPDGIRMIDVEVVPVAA